MTTPKRASGPMSAPTPVIDREDALERMEGDKALLEELLVIFSEDYPSKKADIDRAVSGGDGEALRRAAHALKGAAANLSLMALRENAYQLELAGKEGRLAKAPDLIKALESEFAKFEDHLRTAGKPQGWPAAPPGGPPSGRSPESGSSRVAPLGRNTEASPKKILIIDDARDTRRLIKTWAEEAAVAADTAADGAEALGRVEACAYDVIFLDLNLGRQDGTEVLAGIRSIEKRAGRRQARVIAFSAAAPSEVEKKCREAGFDDCLEKPIARTAFLAQLGSGLAKEKANPAGTAIDLSIDDLIPAYLQNRRNDVRLMTKALAAGEWHVIAELGHKIKGSGSSYGFPEISDLGRELERAAGAKERDAVRAALAGLATRVKEAARSRRSG